MGRCGPPVGVGSFRHSVATVHSGGAPCAAPTIACSRQRACIRPARSVAAEGIGRVQSRGLAPHLPGPERAAEEHTGPAPPTKSRCRCGRGEPGPGADVAGVSHLATSAHDLISSCACLTFGAAYLRIGPGADWAHPCTRTGLTHWAHPCTSTGLTPSPSCYADPEPARLAQHVVPVQVADRTPASIPSGSTPAEWESNPKAHRSPTSSPEHVAAYMPRR
jgi:hypothetical protein